MAEPLSEQEKALMVAGTRATQLGGSTFSVSLLDPKSIAEYEAYEENIKVQYRTWWYQQSAQHIENQMRQQNYPIPPAKTYEQIMGIPEETIENSENTEIRNNPQVKKQKSDSKEKSEIKENSKIESPREIKVKESNKNLLKSGENLDKNKVEKIVVDDEKIPSTSNNQLLPPLMVQQNKALGLKEFTKEDLDGNPAYAVKFETGSWNDKCMIHGEWMQFQINYFENEKKNGRYYPALGDKEKWERKQKIEQKSKFFLIIYLC